MANRCVVSTECPTCGAPLDFGEGSNAVRCSHCRSNLLVTGRKQVLSYSIAPRLDAHRVMAKAVVGHKERGVPCRVVKRQLYFVPYYRMTGQDFLWEVAPPKPRIEASASVTEGQDLLPEGEEIEFRDRYVEKNFVACDLPGLGMYSLGIRPAVLRLELFRRETLEAIGRVVSITISADRALSLGMKAVDSTHVLYRQVIGKVLSVVYFPFWVVEIESEGENRLTILDAVAETVIQLDAPLSLYTILDRKPTSDPLVAGFRPLACPNCGWDLPLRPDDVIFFCSSCDRAWQIRGSQLSEVSYQIANGHRAEIGRTVKYLPLWVLQAEVDQRPMRFFLPAFRYRRLKFLSELAIHLSRKQPSYGLSSEKGPEVHGGYYDQDDAVMLAQFTYAGLMSASPGAIRALQEDRFSVAGAALTWLPFKVEGGYLIDPLIGQYLPQALLL